jgi:teichuronic acid exporter
VNVFTQNGIWDKLIQTDEKDLPQLCQTAYCLNWIVCGALLLIQGIVSVTAAWFYKDTQIILPICAMATVYLIIPFSLVQASLLLAHYIALPLYVLWVRRYISNLIMS